MTDKGVKWNPKHWMNQLITTNRNFQFQSIFEVCSIFHKKIGDQFGVDVKILNTKTVEKD